MTILKIINVAIMHKLDSLTFSVKSSGISMYSMSNNGVRIMDYSPEIIHKIIDNIYKFYNVKKSICVAEKSYIKTIEVEETDYEVKSFFNYTNLNEYEITLFFKNVDKKYFNKIDKSNSYYVMFDEMVRYALKHKASEIMIGVYGEIGSDSRANIKFRGFEEDYKDISIKEGYQLCKTIFNIMNNRDLNDNETDNFMNCISAGIDYPLGQETVKIRYGSIMAYPSGFGCVISVLPIVKEERVFLQNMGYTEQQANQLEAIVNNGSMIIAGVTGSGKSTSARVLLTNLINDEKLNSNSEASIPMMIGEIRDTASANLLREVIESGQHALATVHASSTSGAIDRLVSLGLSRSLMSSNLSGLSYQKLVKKVCPHCAIDFNALIKSGRATKKEQHIYAYICNRVNPLDYPLKKKNTEGCEVCDKRGGQGMSVCAEIITLDETMRHLIENEKSIKDYWHSLSDKNPASENMLGKTWKEHLFQKAFTGSICVYELDF